MALSSYQNTYKPEGPSNITSSYQNTYKPEGPSNITSSYQNTYKPEGPSNITSSNWNPSTAYGAMTSPTQSTRVNAPSTPAPSAYDSSGRQISFDASNAKKYLNPLSPSTGNSAPSGVSAQSVGYGLHGGSAQPSAQPAQATPGAPGQPSTTMNAPLAGGQKPYDPDGDPYSIMNQYARVHAETVRQQAEKAQQEDMQKKFQQQLAMQQWMMSQQQGGQVAQPPPPLGGCRG